MDGSREIEGNLLEGSVLDARNYIQVDARPWLTRPESFNTMVALASSAFSSWQL